MAGLRWLGITLILTLHTLLCPAPALGDDGGEDPAFSLSIEGSNNHFDLETLLPKISFADLGSTRPQFDNLMGWGDVLLRVSLAEDDQWGLYAQLLAWYWSSGETSLFVYNAMAERLPAAGELYDLETQSEQYVLLGLYISRETGWLDRGEGRFYFNAFICPYYEVLTLMGYGYLYPENGEQEIQAQATGQHDILPWGDPFGLGGSLSWQGHFARPSGLAFDLEAHNLLGLVYFPGLPRYNDRLDYQSVSPTPIEGHLERGQIWVFLPCLLKGTFSYPCFGGEAQAVIVRMGKVQDLELSFAYPVTERLKLTAGYDPILANLSLGLRLPSLECRLVWGEKLMGLGFSMKI